MKLLKILFKLVKAQDGQLDIKIWPEQVFHKILDKERERAGRNNHNFSLILLSIGTIGNNHKLEHRLFAELKKCIRNVDELGWYDKRHFGIILPYTSKQGAFRFAERAFEVLKNEVPTDMYDIYSYPQTEFHEDLPTKVI